MIRWLFWDTSLPPSWSASFPNKVVIPCLNTSSTDLLVCHGASRGDLDSVTVSQAAGLQGHWKYPGREGALGSRDHPERASIFWMDIYKVKSLRNVELVVVNASLLISSLLACFFFPYNFLSSLGLLPDKVDFTGNLCLSFPPALHQKGILCH